MSRWVTIRTAVGPTGETSTPPSRAPATNSAASSRGTTTMFVSTVEAAGLGQDPGVGMVVREPVDVVVEGVQPGGREDADLAHAAAHPLAPDACLRDRLPRSHDQRADRGTEPLRQADGDHVGTRAVRREGDARRDVGVPD